MYNVYPRVLMLIRCIFISLLTNEINAFNYWLLANQIIWAGKDSHLPRTLYTLDQELNKFFQEDKNLDQCNIDQQVDEKDIELGKEKRRKDFLRLPELTSSLRWIELIVRNYFFLAIFCCLL